MSKNISRRSSPAHCVGVITSKTGAALHDILHVLRRRDPGLPVIIYPTAVQGDDAPGQIVRAIALANARQECDVLIVGRGGGSLEDLWSFNDERVARAIFASQIPIVSAVGHETDVTIADFVADLRAPTPSAAAEIVSRNQQELLRQLQSGQQRLEMAMDYFLASRQRRFTQLFHRLQQQHPQLRLARQQTALERLRQRMRIAVESQLKRAEQRQKRTVQRLNHYNPQQRIHRAQSRIQQLEYRLAEIMRGRLSERRERFGNAVTHLEAVSPLATLARGYSVTSVSDGTVLKQTKQVKTGDLLTTRLKDGWVESEVKQIAPVKKRGPESLRPLNQRNKFHPFFRDKAMPMLAKVIHRAARLQHLQRLVAFRQRASRVNTLSHWAQCALLPLTSNGAWHRGQSSSITIPFNVYLHLFYHVPV